VADAWIFELKHDGFRALARSGTRVQILSRWGRSMTAQSPETAAALARLPDAVLDGELVVPTAKGRSDFEELRRRNLLQRPRMIAEAATRRPAVLVVFDLLQLGSDDLRARPLLERRRALHQHIEPLPGVKIIEHIETHGEPLFHAIVDGDHEGIVAKRFKAPYRAGPRNDWLKIKNRAYSRRGAADGADKCRERQQGHVSAVLRGPNGEYSPRRRLFHWFISCKDDARRVTMPLIPDIPFARSRVQGARFHPMGLVLHRTEAGYTHCLQGFQAGPKCPHFLIGKNSGQVVQLIDTAFAGAHVGPGANNLYLGIEFESIPARRGVRGQDPLVNKDPLTPFQASIGQDIVRWISATHGIPRVGPPTSAQWRACHGHWHGVLGHANVAEGNFFRTDHGDTLEFMDFVVLAVWPR